MKCAKSLFTAESLALSDMPLYAAILIAARIAITTMTMSNSTMVKPWSFVCIVGFILFMLLSVPPPRGWCQGKHITTAKPHFLSPRGRVFEALQNHRKTPSKDGVFLWSAQNDTQQTYLQDSLYAILRNHQQFRDRVEKLQRIVDNAVKPEGLELIKFL